ncbi:MAG TPA: 4'-phosphopantetheinyl transferase superfamily protein [Puia sp.]|jgi:phosphopantetheine--protein transferase-like protein|nr:4'-phosphopantetheinyl transferase superfamily protein [Puia sp.]
MEEKIKEIVSTYIKLPVAQISESTPIGRTALQSSILMHRMYARLGEEGVVVSDYAEIKVFGDLMRKQGAGVGAQPAVGAGGVIGSQPSIAMTSAGIGIDIEEVAALPRVADLRKEAFYTQNFTPSEIAYCILQADPYSSLAGLFAAKEAIVKADGQYRNRPFHTVEISHTADGKPVFPGLGLSISHAAGMAVAVAAPGGAVPYPGSSDAAAPVGEAVIRAAGKPASTGWITWIALLLAAAALLLALKH